MKDTSLRDDTHGDTDHPCAQPPCRHSRDDHGDSGGAETNCRLCTCSEYVSRSRMIGRRMLWAMLSSGTHPGSLGR
jgi:hypothetical protein